MVLGPLAPEAERLGVVDGDLLGVVQVDRIVDVAVRVELEGPDPPLLRMLEPVDAGRLSAPVVGHRSTWKGPP
jgi:hypothetical protein